MADVPTGGGALRALGALKDVTLPQAIIFGIISLLVMHFIPGEGSSTSQRVAEILQNVIQQQNLHEFRLKSLEAVDVAHTSEIQRNRDKLESLSIKVGGSVRP